VTELIVAGIMAVAAIAVGFGLRRHRRFVPPAPVEWVAPTHLDRADFPTADGRAWLVAVFSSGTCSTCADVVRKANVLASPAVAVVDVEYATERALHAKYRIEAVPIACLADDRGVVRASFVGPVTATDLWAAVAEARQPGSRPDGECAGPNG
jgi:hypothetical protein